MRFNIPNPFQNRPGNSGLSSNAMVSMTNDGKQALDRMMLNGNEYQIMLALDSSGSMSVGNLARDARVGLNQAEMQVKRLRSKGYVALREYDSNE